MIALVLGLLACATALVVVAVVVLVPPTATLSEERRKEIGVHDPDADLRSFRERTIDAADRAIRKRGWRQAIEDELELAGIRVEPASFIVSLLLVASAAAVAGILLGFARPGPLSVLLPVLAVIAVGIIARLLVGQRIAKRRAEFADQLDDTLQLIASGLRAGHSLGRAIDAVAREADSPTAEEFARITNENRLGRDLGVAVVRAAERMKSEDLAWTAQAIDIHREVGGNLGEVLDHVSETIRERNQIKRQVATLSSEGRVSANILLGLPIVIAILLSVISPGYLAVFVEQPLGMALVGVSIILFGLGMLWLRSVVKITF